MDPEEKNIPDGTQGAPTVSSDAEYDNVVAQMSADRKKQKDLQPADPQPEAGKKVASWFENLVPDSNTVPKYAKAVARGVVNAGRETANMLNSMGEATGSVQKQDAHFVEQWDTKPLIDSKPMTDGEVESVLGKRQEGVAGFVENVSQFTTGMVVAGEVLKPLQILSKANTLRTALAGGLADMTVFDPHQARLSDMAQNSPYANVLTGMLANDKNDSELTARLKAGTEGLITGYTLDKFIGGIKALRALKGAKTEAEKSAALDLANVLHNPEVHGPVTVKEVDGAYVLSNVESQKALQSMSESGFAEKPNGSVELPPSDAGKVPTVQAVKYAKAQIGEEEFRRRAEVEIAKRGVKGDVDGEKAAIEEVARRTFHDTLGADRRNVTAEGIRLRAGFDKLAGETGSILDDRRQALIEALKNPVYAKASDAEAVAASTNQAWLNDRQLRGALTGEQTAMLSDHANDLAAAGIPTWVHPDFNFNYSASPVEVKATIQAISEKLPRPAVVQTHAQTVALADDLFDGLTGEQVVKTLADKNIASADIPQFITAARTYLYSTAAKVQTLSMAADAMPSNAIAFNELKKAMTHLYDVHESVAGLSESIGRALDAHKIIVGETGAEEAQRAAIESLTLAEQKAAINGMQKSELMATARLIRMSEGDPNEVLAMMRGQAVLSKAKEKLTGLQQTVDRVNSFRMEAMLSGPRTHFVNTVSNMMAAAQMPVEMWWGGLTSGNKAMRQQGADQLIGLFLESRDAWGAAGKAFRTGVNTLDEAGGIARDAAVSTTGQNNVINGIAKFAHLPSRMLMTSDEFFKTLNYRSSVRAQSLRLARQEGITDASQLAGRLSDDMKAAFNLQGGATNPKALQWARTATFQNPLEYGYGKAWQEVIQKHPELRLITPFVRTPVNLFRYAWQRTPILGAFQGQMRADIMAGGERKALAMAKQQMGMAAWTGAALLAHNKIITGGGPKDPQLRSQWLAAGNQPYSVRVPGGGWMSYARANPTFNALGIVADLHEMSGEIPEGKHTELAAAWAAAVATNVTNQTFMQGLSDALDAFSHGDPHQMARLASNTVGSFVPNIARQMNPDDAMRETRGMVDELSARVPGMSTSLEPRRNIFGEPIMKAPGYANHSLNPFTFMANPGDHSVQQELLTLGKAMSMPSPMKGNIDMSDRTLYGDGKNKQSPYDRQLQLVSKSKARSELTAKVNSPEWSRYSDDRKFEEASIVLSKYQHDAYKQVLSEYPKLDAAINGQRRDKAAAMRSRPAAAPQFITP